MADPQRFSHASDGARYCSGEIINHQKTSSSRRRLVEEARAVFTCDQDDAESSQHVDPPIRGPFSEIHSNSLNQSPRQTQPVTAEKKKYQRIDRSPHQASPIPSWHELEDLRHVRNAYPSKNETPLQRFENEPVKDQPWNGIAGFMIAPRTKGSSNENGASSIVSSKIAEEDSNGVHP